MIETSSDRNFACFVCSDSSAGDKNTNCPQCGSPIDIGSEFIGTRVDKYTIVEYIGRGYYGLTFKCVNNLGIDCALKIIPKKIYMKNSKDFELELKKYVSLRSHPNIARLDDGGECSVSVSDHNIECFFLVMEWIEGRTLRKVLEEEEITAADVFSICTEIASALDRFEGKQLCHNDLNADNIMVVDLKDDELGTRRTTSKFQIKVIDTGSAIFKSQRKHNRVSDLSFLGLHIAHMIDVVKRSKFIPLEQQAFLDTLERYVGRLRDEDEGRGFSSAHEFNERLHEAYDQSQRYEIEANETLKTPFEYLNALDFSDNSTLVGRLFHDDFPWIRDFIKASEQNVLVTGPRGCGKTMILKNLRFRTKLLQTPDEPNPETFKAVVDKEQAFGLFVSARVEIGNNLFIQKLPVWARSNENIICLFQLLYALEALETLVLIKARFKVEFDLRAEFKFCDLINSAINQTAHTLNEALSDVRTSISRIMKNEFAFAQAGKLTGGGFLSELCKSFLDLHASFRGKVIVFLLDDFSKPKIPAEIQKALLPLIWSPGEGYFFKVSAHSRSTETIDYRGNQYDAHREFTEVNLGNQYLNYTNNKSGRTEVEKTISSILRKRFSLSANKSESFVEPGEFLGDSPQSIAQALRDAKKAKTSYKYRGWKTIIALCSGEISFLIDVYGRLYESYSEKDGYPIKAAIQNQIIKEHCKQELLNLQYLPQVHTNLYECAYAFGRMSQYKLINNKVKNGSKSRYAEYTRMEVELQDISSTAIDAMNELISSGVFIDAGRSSSSSGRPTQRLLFRKIFTPAFPTTWVNKDSFSWNQERFIEFIREPKLYWKRYVGEDSDDGSLGPLFDK